MQPHFRASHYTIPATSFQLPTLRFRLLTLRDMSSGQGGRTVVPGAALLVQPPVPLQALIQGGRLDMGRTNQGIGHRAVGSLEGDGVGAGLGVGVGVGVGQCRTRTARINGCQPLP